ncbi:MAG: S8 family serine peptidase [Rhodoluna sp.]
MKLLRGLLAAAIAIGLSALSVAPAHAATNPILTDTSFDAVGLIVKYNEGVSSVASNGQPTAENAAGVDLSFGRDLGDGWNSVAFAHDASAGTATSIALRMAADPRVSSVELDRRLVAASAALRPSAAALRALTPASQVRSVKASDAWSKTAPTSASIKLTWTMPTALYGASISGYRVEANNGSGWKFLTTALKNSTVLTKGLVAGITYSFRVAAITKKAGASKVGAFSSPVKAMATSAPQAPVFTGSNTAFGTTSPSWAPQNKAQSGGLPILGYSAVASASGQTPVTCEAPASATTCSFSNLAPNVTYTVSVSAKNARGLTASVAGVTPLDALFKDQWYLTAKFGINAPNAWSKTMGSKNVIVAVIDSGITSHQDLDNQVIPGYDFVSDPASSNDGDGWDSNNADPGDYFGNEASSWHGTHVAGIIAAQSNSIGVTGIAPNVKIQPIRALGSDGGNSSDLIAALHWAAGIHVAGVPDNKTPAQVVNLSMGTDSNTPCRLPGQSVGATEAALADLKNAGVTVISAAGNFNVPAYESYPGNCFPTINVGATAFSGDRASYSNYSVLDSAGQMVGVDISAPGGDSKFPGDSPAGTNGKIVSTLNDGLKGPGAPIYRGEEGTSMAAPVVSGVVALIYSVKPKINFDQVWEVLKATVTKFPAGSSCEAKLNCGAGIVNAGAAVAAAAALP